MLLTTDKRRLEFWPAPELIASGEHSATSRRENEIDLAQTLHEIDRKKAYVEKGFASTLQLGARQFGLAAREGRMLLRLGKVLSVRPGIADELLALELTTPAAAAIQPILCDPDLQDEHDDWLERARREPLTKLVRAVRRRVQEVRTGELIVDLTVHVPESVEEGFLRAQDLASETAGRALTRSETFEVLVDHYLDSFDPARTAEGERRVGPTVDRPRDRYIPIAVRREIRRRAENTCEFPGCDHRRHLQFAHWRTSHCEGSPREVEDLLLLCWLHHLLLDARFFCALGKSDDPVFIDQAGKVFTKRSPGGRAPANEAEEAAWRAHSKQCPASEAPNGAENPGSDPVEDAQAAPVAPPAPQEERQDDAARAPPSAA